MRRHLTAAPTLLLALACGSENAIQDAGVDGGGAADGAARDAESSTDAQPSTDADPRPILERPAELRFDCQVSRAVVDHAPLSWYGQGQSLAVSGGRFMLARVQGAIANPQTARLVVSTIDPIGLGASTTIAADATMIFDQALAPTADGWALAWSENGAIRFVRQSPAGLSAPREVARPGGVQSNLQLLARAGGGYALIWQSRASFDVPAELQLALLDGDGALSGSARMLVRAAMQYNDLPARLVERSGGFALIWAESEPPASRVRFALLDPSGALGSPIVLAQSADQTASFSTTALALIARPNGFLAAWPEGFFNGDFNDPHGHTVVRLAGLDASGRPSGPIAALQSIEDNIDHVEPDLIAIDDAVGLIWSRGTRIYVCAGCIPDHGLRLVVLDPDRLIPLSSPLSIDDGVSGGLLRHNAALIGRDLALAFRIGFHVHSEPGSAFARCDPR